MIGILYFSSTGNSLYIAQRLQKTIGGEIKYIPTYKGNGSEYDRIFIVTPIFSFGMPTFVFDLLPRLDKTKELIIIQNYGGMVAGADYLTYNYAKENQLNIKSIYVLRMPINFTTTFTEPKFFIRRVLKSADKRIDKVILRIKENKYRIPKKKITLKKAYYKNKSNWHIIGESFSVTDSCIKCGKCISICPVNNISFKEGKVVFSNKCVACLSCYQRCPNKAIIYKKHKKKDRYINPNIDENKIGKDF